MHSKAFKHTEHSNLTTNPRRHKLTIGLFLAMTLGSTVATQALAETYIDALILHTPGLSDRYNGNATTRINHLVSVTNQIYAYSGLDITLRPVHIKQVNYSDTTDPNTALNAMTYARGPSFSGIPALREQHRADVVILMRPYHKSARGLCGLAFVGGIQAQGKLSAYKNYMYSYVAATSCGDYTTAHEIGHNLGLGHSRLQGSQGTWDFSVGYGVEERFTTVMAYAAAFHVNYWAGKMYKFSSPSLTCRGEPCGVNKNDRTNGADAVYTLKHTAPIVENFYQTLLSPEASQQDELLIAENKYNEAEKRMYALYGELKESYQRAEEYTQRLMSIAITWTEPSDFRTTSQWRSLTLKTKLELLTYQRIRESLAQQEKVLRATRIALADARKSNNA